MADRSISETKRVRYLLGLSFPTEREHLEAEYFADDDAFQEMLTAEDDLIDAYARGELEGEERQRFEKRYGSSLNGRDRVQFARAFAGTISAAMPVEPKLNLTFPSIFKTFKSPGLSRIVTVAVVIVFVAALASLVSDRRRVTDQLHRATDESSDTERTGTAEIAAQTLDPRPKPDKHRHPRSKVQTALTRSGYVAGRRADQTNLTLDGLSVDPADTYLLIQQKTSNSGGTTVRGTAKDPNGNIVSGATVTLTDSTKNFTRTQLTDKDGAYVFNEIPPGTYSIEVKAPGFKTASASGLIALVDAPTVRDVQLEVGAVSESVDVTSGAELRNTEDGTLGDRFENKLITQLPLEARDVPGLLTLQSGVTRTFSLEDGRASQSNITLAGVDVPIPGWIKFQIPLETAATHEDFRITIETADGRSVTTDTRLVALKTNQTVILLIRTTDLPPGDYVLLLMGKEPDGSFVKVAECSFKVI